MLNKMDNPSFGKDEKTSEKGIELSVASTNGTTSTAENFCTPGVCRTARQRYQSPDLAGSPWQFKKTLFLIALIVLLVIWIVVFTTLSQLKLL